jgi:hypothetical protein
MTRNKEIEVVDKAGSRTVVTLEEIEMRLLMYLSRREMESLIKSLESTL